MNVKVVENSFDLRTRPLIADANWQSLVVFPAYLLSLGVLTTLFFFLIFLLCVLTVFSLS